MNGIFGENVPSDINHQVVAKLYRFKNDLADSYDLMLFRGLVILGPDTKKLFLASFIARLDS